MGGKLAKYSDNGSTLSAVNFPEVSLPGHALNANRLLHIHENRPGMLTSINQIFTDRGINIAAQYLQTAGELGYVVIDMVANNPQEADEVLLQLKSLPGTVRARQLF